MNRLILLLVFVSTIVSCSNESKLTILDKDIAETNKIMQDLIQRDSILRLQLIEVIGEVGTEQFKRENFKDEFSSIRNEIAKNNESIKVIEIEMKRLKRMRMLELEKKRK